MTMNEQYLAWLCVCVDLTTISSARKAMLVAFGQRRGNKTQAKGEGGGDGWSRNLTTGIILYSYVNDHLVFRGVYMLNVYMCLHTTGR